MVRLGYLKLLPNEDNPSAIELSRKEWKEQRSQTKFIERKIVLKAKRMDEGGYKQYIYKHTGESTYCYAC